MTLIKESNSIAAQDDINLAKMSEEAQLKRKGGLITLKILFEVLGPSILQKLPQLRSILFDSLSDHENEEASKVDNEQGQKIVDSFGVLRALFPFMSDSLRSSEVFTRFPVLLTFLRSNLSVFVIQLQELLLIWLKFPPWK